MGDLIHKIIAWTTSPLGAFFLVSCAALLLRTRHARLARSLAFGAGAFLWIMSCAVTTGLVGVPLERGMTTPDEVPQVDAIALLGGGMGYDARRGAAEMTSCADRVWAAARLWRPGTTITLSGEDARASTLPLLADFGVDTNCVVAFESARNTEDEAALVAGMDVKRVALVTSAWHMPRAKMLFERKGLEVIPCPTDFEMSLQTQDGLAFKNFLPSADALRLNTYALKEWVARACYAIKRW